MATTLETVLLSLTFLAPITWTHCDRLNDILGKHQAYCGTNLYREVNSSVSLNESASLRIVGGTVADRFEFPWQVSLRRWSIRTKRWYHSCGGVVIDNQWVLTSAHCTMGKNVTTDQFRVRLGEYDYSKAEGQEVDVNVSMIIAHPDFNMITITRDVNLLKLAEPIEFSNFTKLTPICISRMVLNASSSDSNRTEGKNCFSSGWGKLQFGGGFPRILQKVPVNLINQEECQKAYETIAEVTDDMICSGRGGRGTCEGDSGGPLQCIDETAAGDRWTMYGLTSWAVGCAEVKYPSVSARIALFRDWIADRISANT